MWKSEPPKEIDEIIKKYTKSKLPNFFQYVKDKDQKTQVEPANNSTMNRISARISDARIKWNKSIGKFDWTMLLNKNYDYTIRENSAIVERYNWWLVHQNRFDFGEDAHINEDDLYKYRCIAKDIIDYTHEDVQYITNSLIAYLYTVKKSNNKKMLWACFGDVIVENIRNNVSGKVCVICGKRFEPITNNQLTCCEKCGNTLDIQNKRKRRETFSVIQENR